MKNKIKIVLIGESNFLLDVAFERQKDCLYLRDLAVAKELQLVIPEYAFAEVEAKLASREVYLLNMFEKAKAALEELPASRRRKKAHARRLNTFDDCIALASDSLKGACDGVNTLYAVTLPNQESDLKMIFLERDKAHFDVPEVKAELADVNVEIYFSAGEVVKCVRELLSK